MTHRELFIDCADLFKIYQIADLQVVALRGLDLAVERGEMVAVAGASGSGKSTLLNVLAGFETPSAGRVHVWGEDLQRLSQADAVAYRRERVGFVWQNPSHNLVPYLTARQNVELPPALTGMPAAERRARAEELLELVGLAHRMEHTPSRLSGGEQQRLAIAVALANHPPLLLADEPTGELDSETGAAIWRTLQEINRALGATMVAVTHDDSVFTYVDRLVYIRDGRISTEHLHRFAFRRPEEGSPAWEEFNVVDRTGRIQLPRALLERLRISSRARVFLHDDHIAVYREDAEHAQ